MSRDWRQLRFDTRRRVHRKNCEHASYSVAIKYRSVSYILSMSALLTPSESYTVTRTFSMEYITPMMLPRDDASQNSQQSPGHIQTQTLWKKVHMAKFVASLCQYVCRTMKLLYCFWFVTLLYINSKYYLMAGVWDGKCMNCLRHTISIPFCNDESLPVW